MAKIDQRKYLKKYLEDDHSDHRKKKKREHSESHSGRVKIIDDDAHYARKRNYEDDNDLILTGEDAPQVVGIIDDRPPELKTIEDFRSSGKWKSVPSTATTSAGGERSRSDHGKEPSRRDRRRSPSSEKDYSPKRSDSSKRRPASDDYSPPRRKHERKANLFKREKRSSSSYSDHSHKRGDDRPSNRSNYSGRYGKTISTEKEGSSYRSAATSGRPRSPPPQTQPQKFYDCRKQRENLPSESTSRFKRDDSQRSSYATQQYSGSAAATSSYDRKPPREEPVKFNPFRSNPVPQSNVQQTQQHHHPQPTNQRATAGTADSFRTQSPAAAKHNPFRSNPQIRSLSPLPDRRGAPPSSLVSSSSSNGRNNSFRSQPPSNELSGNRFDNRTAKNDFKNGSTLSSEGRKGFNPFRANDPPRELSPLPAIRGGSEKNRARNNSAAAAPPLRSHVESKLNSRESSSHPDSKDRARTSAWNANGGGSSSNAFRSSSPAKPNNRDNQPKSESRFDSSDRRNQATASNRRGNEFISRQNSRDANSPPPRLASQISDTRARPTSDYVSGKNDSKKDRWDNPDYRRR